MKQQLKNKTAIVTGASGGYGVGIATSLKKAGADVWIIARSKNKLEKVAEEIGAQPFCGDVTRIEDWERLFATIEKTGKSVDILVNNAGGGVSLQDIDNQSDDDILSSISLNLTSSVLGSKRAAKIMKSKKSGIIIQISSICAQQCWPGWSVYGAAKAGLEHFSRGLYCELRPHNVRAVCITPSWGATGFNNAAQLPSSSEDDRMRMISPDDMGQLVLQVCTTPGHLVIPEVTLLPIIQEIIPY